ncbi:glycosyltransferase [Roseomonas sp. CAU 1739]|uniref:glycosyltransferase n=1 Tax=Roseomonas sp. CAU 1739 TaxID=3140364 RepID=UPI00325A9958
MRVMAFSTVFPSAATPEHGLFVLERLRHCAAHAQIEVLAPRAFHARPAVPSRESIGGLDVSHPAFWYSPRYGKALDGAMLYLSSLRAARGVMRRFDFDLIDAHFGYPDGFAAVLLGRSLNRPVVITLRGTEPLVAAADRLRRRALAWALRRADRLIAVSHPLAEGARDLMAEYGPMESAPPIEVIANGVDARRFAPGSREQARRDLGLPEGGRLLVSVGHRSPRKGFQRVIRVLPEVLQAAPDLRFAVIGGAGGEPDNGPELRRLADELGMGDRVILAGPLPPGGVAAWLRAADLFVLASDHEGCPNVVWEAQASGLPVVATRVGEIPRMVPEFAGRLIDHAEDSAALAAALIAGLAGPFDVGAIRGWAERHTWDDVATRVVEQWRLAVASAPALGRRATSEGVAA